MARSAGRFERHKISFCASLDPPDVFLQDGFSRFSEIARRPAHPGAGDGEQSRKKNGKRQSDDGDVEDSYVHCFISLCDSNFALQSRVD
jgi:hypothetical protein